MVLAGGQDGGGGGVSEGSKPRATYIIIVGVAHGKASVHLISTAGAAANTVLEGVTASPMTATAPGVAIHGIRRGKPVPRTNQVDSRDRWIRLTIS